MNRLLKDALLKRCETQPQKAFKAEPPTKLFRMYSDFCTQWKAERGSRGGPRLNVVLACQDCQAAMHAFEVCRDLFKTVNQELDFGFRNAWRFDSLRNSDLREKAIRETICADMVVISAHAPWIIPAGTKWWLDTALEQREGDPGALVLLLDGIPAGHAVPILPIEAYLAECAQNGGMELFIRRSRTSRRNGFRAKGIEKDNSDFSGPRGPLKMDEVGRIRNQANHFEVGFKQSPLIFPPRQGGLSVARIGKGVKGPARPVIRTGRISRFAD